MTDPYFSIIMPVCNVAQYLRECLDSVLAQTFLSWEVLCVDDGSTDNSGEILDEYASRDSRFRVIHKKNDGVSVARNVALDCAIGEYIAFLDSDDLIDSDWLGSIFQCIQEHHGVDWIRTRYKLWCAENLQECGIGEDEVRVTGEAARRVAWERVVNAGYVWLNVFRRSLVGEIRFRIGHKWREDTCFCANIIRNINSFLQINKSNYIYRVRLGSASHRRIDWADVKVAIDDFLLAWGSCPGEPKMLSVYIFKCMAVNTDYPESYTNEIRAYFCKIITNKDFQWRYISYQSQLRWRLFLKTGWKIAVVPKRGLLAYFSRLIRKRGRHGG